MDMSTTFFGTHIHCKTLVFSTIPYLRHSYRKIDLKLGKNISIILSIRAQKKHNIKSYNFAPTFRTVTDAKRKLVKNSEL